MEVRISASQIVDTAKSYLDTPFRHRGRNRAGIDCAGLIICVFNDLGIMPEGYLEQLYSNVPKPGLVEDTLYRFFKTTDNPKASDIMVFNFLNNPCHVGFYTGDTVIHAYQERGKVIEDEFKGKWEKRLNNCYRVIE
jgi:cell wall-associated NlpC family hydrolase